MRWTKLAALAAGCFFMLGGMGADRANASTVTFDWTLTGPAASLGGVPLPGSGTITATVGTSGDLVTGITGTIGGSAITGLTSFLGSDNLIFPSGTGPLDTKGLAFTTAAGDTIDIFSFFAEGSTPSGNAYGEDISGTDAGFGVGTFALSPVSTTPLPPTWTMMLAGLTGLAFLLYRKQKQSAAFGIA
jgi:hypothetical protein